MRIKNEKRGENVWERALHRLIPAIIVLLVIVLASYIARFYSASFSQRTEDWGTLGDYFGGLMNPVISFATLIVAYAIWKQQKIELSETKVALKDQAKRLKPIAVNNGFLTCFVFISKPWTTPLRHMQIQDKGAPEMGKKHWIYGWK